MFPFIVWYVFDGLISDDIPLSSNSQFHEVISALPFSNKLSNWMYETSVKSILRFSHPEKLLDWNSAIGSV